MNKRLEQSSRSCNLVMLQANHNVAIIMCSWMGHFVVNVDAQRKTPREVLSKSSKMLEGGVAYNGLTSHPGE